MGNTSILVYSNNYSNLVLLLLPASMQIILQDTEIFSHIRQPFLVHGAPTHITKIFVNKLI